MQELTFAKCKVECRGLTFSCCSPEYCVMAIEIAKEKGVELVPTGHPKLPLMGESGCIAEPYLRPLCSLHSCERLLWSDPKFSKEYFKLRDKLTTVEWKEEWRDRVRRVDGINNEGERS